MKLVFFGREFVNCWWLFSNILRLLTLFKHPDHRLLKESTVRIRREEWDQWNKNTRGPTPRSNILSLSHGEGSCRSCIIVFDYPDNDSDWSIYMTWRQQPSSRSIRISFDRYYRTFREYQLYHFSNSNQTALNTENNQFPLAANLYQVSNFCPSHHCSYQHAVNIEDTESPLATISNRYHYLE